MLFIQLVDKLRFFVLLSCMLCTYQVSALIVGTYNAPPFSMNEDNDQIGLATEIINDLLIQANIPDHKIINYPLQRGLVELRQGRIDIFYPYIVDLSLPQQQGTLIGPISKYRLALFARADNNMQISLATMQPYPIAAERGGLGNTLLQQRNLKLELTSDKTSCLTMVFGKRVSACAIGILPGMYLAALNNMYEKLRFVPTELYSDMYLLIGAHVQPEITAAIQSAYVTLQQQHYFEKKQADYERKFQIFIDSMK